MTAQTLRDAARILRERAERATPGPWSAADEHGLMPEAWPAWCVSQMRPGYQSMSPEDGYVRDVAYVHGDDKDANPDADYIAMLDPRVGLAIADWLDSTASTMQHVMDDLAAAEGQPTIEQLVGYDFVEAIDVARAILGES